LLPYEKGFEVFSFDFAGNFLGAQVWSCGERWETSLPHFEREMGYSPAAIRVKRFSSGACHFLDYPTSWLELPYPNLRGAAQLEYVQYWFAEVQFEWTEGNSPWVNRRGEIVAT